MSKRSTDLCLSIRQPWAWLIMHGGKDIENRTWPTKVRGRVWIHAAKGCTSYQWVDAVGFADFSMADPTLVVPPPRVIDRGGIIGSVEIVDCVDQSDSPWFQGPHGFVLSDPKSIAFKPCRGALGFFKHPEGRHA